MDDGPMTYGSPRDPRRNNEFSAAHSSPGGRLDAPRGEHRPSEGAAEPVTGLAMEVGELVSCEPDVSLVLCDAFLYEPESREERLGTLAVVLETLQVPAAEGRGHEGYDLASTRELLDDLAETLRDEYYRDPEREPLPSFEAALTAANGFLAGTAKLAPDWVTNFHAAVIVFFQRTLHVSRVGAASVLLARHGHLTDVSEGLSDPNVRNPKAAFTSIASGTVSEHDVLVLASPQFTRVLPRDRVAAFVTGKHPRDVIRYLRDLTADAEETTPFAVLFLRCVRTPIALPAPPRESRALDPLLRAGTTAVAAAMPVPPPPRPRIVPRPPLQVSRSWIRRIPVFLRRGSVLVARLLIARAGPALARAGVFGARAAQSAAARTSRSARALYARAQSGQLGSERPEGSAWPWANALASRLKAAPSEARQAVRVWPRSTKVFAVLTLALAVLFVGSLGLLRQKREEETAIRHASEQLQSAIVKKDAAEAALIYDNVDDARRLLREARESLTSVERTPYYETAVANLRSTIQADEDRMEGILRIAEPVRVGDFRSVAPDGRVTGLAFIGKDLFVFDPETNAIYRLSTESGNAASVSQSSQGIGYFRHVTALVPEQMLLFATDSPGLAIFDAARGDLVKQDVDQIPEGAKQIRGLATFGSRLYLLFPEQRQIFGYSKTLSGYTGGAPWLKDQNVPVDRAASIGVDGYIYVLTEDGKIVKLLKGVPVEFTQSELSTPLRHPTSLVIHEGLKFLYVLDPSEKRVVVYDTTGKLSRQFVFPNAQDLRDITIAGKDETLYALDGTSVYKVSLK